MRSGWGLSLIPGTDMGRSNSIKEGLSLQQLGTMHAQYRSGTNHWMLRREISDGHTPFLQYVFRTWFQLIKPGFELIYSFELSVHVGVMCLDRKHYRNQWLSE